MKQRRHAVTWDGEGKDTPRPQGPSTGYTAGVFLRFLFGHLVVISLAALLWLAVRGGAHESRLSVRNIAPFDASHPVFPALAKIKLGDPSRVRNVERPNRTMTSVGL